MTQNCTVLTIEKFHGYVPLYVRPNKVYVKFYVFETWSKIHRSDVRVVGHAHEHRLCPERADLCSKRADRGAGLYLLEPIDVKTKK